MVGLTFEVTMIDLLLVASLSCSNAQATFYHDRFEGRRMANGQVFRQSSDSAASATIPLGSRVLVRRGTQSTWVTVRDRMPTRGVIDLTTSRFRQIGNLSEGRIQVQICR